MATAYELVKQHVYLIILNIFGTLAPEADDSDGFIHYTMKLNGAPLEHRAYYWNSM